MVGKTKLQLVRAITILVLLGVTLAPVGQVAAQARNWFVSRTGSHSAACTRADPCNLEAAYRHAAAGDTIILQGGGYYMPGIKKPLYFYGSWTGNPTGVPVYDPVGSRTIIAPYMIPMRTVIVDYPPELGVVVLRDMTINGGKAVGLSGTIENGGCVDLQRGTLYLNNVRVAECEADFGGGIFVSAYQTIYITNSIIENNTARIGGGGLALSLNASGFVQSSTFYNNSGASEGSAIGVYQADFNVRANTFYYHPGVSTVHFFGESTTHRPHFINNMMGGSAGVAVSVEGYSGLRMDHNTFTANVKTVLEAKNGASVLFRNNIVGWSGQEANVLIAYDTSQIQSERSIYRWCSSE